MRAAPVWFSIKQLDKEGNAMPLEIKKSVKEMFAEASSAIETLGV